MDIDANKQSSRWTDMPTLPVYAKPDDEFLIELEYNSVFLGKSRTTIQHVIMNYDNTAKVFCTFNSPLPIVYNDYCHIKRWQRLVTT